MKIQTTVKNELPTADCRMSIHAGSGVTRHGFSTENRKSKIENGFTLVEILLVMTIIGILAAIVIPKMVGRSEQARQTAVRADISSIKTALDAFEVDNGYYPKSLQDLVQQPGNAKNWHGPYLENLPQDPWQNPYIYTYPGRHNVNSYDIMSAGPDGKTGTDDDIGNWTK